MFDKIIKAHEGMDVYICSQKTENVEQGRQKKDAGIVAAARKVLSGSLLRPNRAAEYCNERVCLSVITQKNYLKLPKIILKLIVLFMATIQDQRTIYIFFE